MEKSYPLLKSLTDQLMKEVTGVLQSPPTGVRIGRDKDGKPST